MEKISAPPTVQTQTCVSHPQLTWFTLTAGIGTGVCCSAAGGVTVLLFELVALRGSFLGAVFPLGGLLRGLGGF